MDPEISKLYIPTGKVYAHHVHCGLQTKRWPGQNIPSGEGKSCEATTRREELSLLLSSKELLYAWSLQLQEQNYRIAGKFGGLAVYITTAKLKSGKISYLHIYVWRSRTEPPNLNPPIFLQ